MTALRTHSVKLEGKCPYCEFTFVILAQNIRGEQRCVRCVDCKQTFVVEIVVLGIESRTHRLASVDVDQVLDELARRGKRPANGATTDRSEAQPAAPVPRVQPAATSTTPTAPPSGPPAQAATRAPAAAKPPAAPKRKERDPIKALTTPARRQTPSLLKRREILGTYGNRPNHGGPRDR